MTGHGLAGACAVRDGVGDGAVHGVDAALVHEPTGVHSGRVTGSPSMMVMSRGSTSLVAKFIASMRELVRVGE